MNLRTAGFALGLTAIALAGCGGGETKTVTVGATSAAPATAQADAPAAPTLSLPSDELKEINRRDDVVQSSVTTFQSALSKCAVLAQNNELDATARCFSEKYKPYDEALIRMMGQLDVAEPKATGTCADKLASAKKSLDHLTTASDDLNESFTNLDFASADVDGFGAAFDRYRTKMDSALTVCQT